MKKFIYVFFALMLVLSLSLVTAVPAGANDTLQVLPYTLEAEGGEETATAEWSTAEANTGSSSVLLDLDNSQTEYAEVAFALPDNVTLANIDLDTTSFWCKSIDGAHIPYFTFELTPFGTWENSFRINNDAHSSTGFDGDEFAQFVASSTTPEWQWFTVDGSGNISVSDWMDWDDLVAQYGTAVVTGVYVGISGLDANAYTAYVDDITVNGTTYYGQIQDAIDSATGTTINVADGTYEESISVTTANLTLRSENGRDNTTIKNVGNVTSPEAAQCGFLIRGSASNFTLGGADGHGFTLKGGTAGRILQLNNAPSGVTISYNTIDTTDTATQGIDCGAASLEDLTVDHCTFITLDTASEVFINGQNVHDSVISNCEFTGTGIMIWGCPNMTYSDNLFQDIGTGISIWSNSLIGEINNNLISGCAFIDCTRGLWLGEGSANKTLITGVTVTDNSFFHGNTTGIQVDDSAFIDTSGLLIDGNIIQGSNPNLTSYTGIKLDGGTGGTISNNCISENTYGIWLDEPVSGVEITGNCIVENGDGVYVEGSDNIITGNVISKNTGVGSGVHLTRTAFGNVINYNDIVFNFTYASGGFGVYNENFVPVDATNNWWGHADGPSMGFIPFEELPAGDTISQYVLYEPYADTPVADATDPVISDAHADPSMVSLWCDGMFGMPNPDGGMWGPGNTYSVGPSCETMISVKATDNNCGIAKVTLNAKQLLLDLIPETKLQKFIDLEYDGEWDNFWAAIVEQMDYFLIGDLEDLEDYPLLPPSYAQEWLDDELDIDCWFSGGWEGNVEIHGASIACLLDSTFTVLGLNPVEMAEIMGQEIVLGDKQILVTAYDYSGNTDTDIVDLTIVDFQMPVCEGWNLRSTWLTLEDNSWKDITATMDNDGANVVLYRWNQRWESYAEVAGFGYWYWGSSQVASALMEPLEAYWINSPYNDQFGLVTSRDITPPPSRDMYAGWSLIGTALGWNQPSLLADDNLISIYEAEGHCTGYTQVLSIDQDNYWGEDFYLCGEYEYPYFGCHDFEPYGDGYYKWFEQDTWVFTRSGNPIDGLPQIGGPPMKRGGGYWVFMANPAVLGGFNSTPLPTGFWMAWADHCMRFIWGP